MSWFKQNAPPQQPMGSLGSLGGVNQGYDWTAGTPDPNQPIYKNSPQPVPGMPPRAFDGPVIGSGFPGGSGQPINQPMVPGSGPSGTWTPQDAARFTQNSGPMPASGGGFISQPMGSLQSLGGGQLNQSGMVNLRGPDGSMKAVPQSDLSHWLSKGATMVSGVGNAVRGMF
jgi:hypothetical protein